MVVGAARISNIRQGLIDAMADERRPGSDLVNAALTNHMMWALPAKHRQR
jgi:hypothetical protein